MTEPERILQERIQELENEIAVLTHLKNNMHWEDMEDKDAASLAGYLIEKGRH